MAHVFISYSTQNSDYAYQLAEKLRSEGFDIWIDNRELRSSDNWWESIVKALRGCDAFIVVMTPEARESRWVQREVTLADNWRKPTFPLLLAGENWEIFVLTQFENVSLPPDPNAAQRPGTLPPPAFYDKLEEFAPRQPRKGANVRSTGEAAAVEIDAELAEEIANPPETSAEIIPAVLPVIDHVPTPPADAPDQPVSTAPPPEKASVEPAKAEKPSRLPKSRRRIALMLVALVVLVVVGAYAFSAIQEMIRNNTPVPGSLVTEIAFISKREDDRASQIYAMKADGTGQLRLTDDRSESSYIDWSPDGTKLAYFSDDGIYVMNGDGTGQQRITPKANYTDTDPNWSPDGKQIVFSSDRDASRNSDYDIFVMNADGSNPQNLTKNQAKNQYPDWSPDGKQIVFSSFQEGHYAIFIMNSDGTNTHRLVESTGIDVQPAWSPDGTKIAFRTNRDGNDEIYLVDVDGQNLQNLSNNPTDDQSPTWSPDGTQIAFMSSRDGNAEIYVMDMYGQNQRNISNNPDSDYDPTWRRSITSPLQSILETSSPRQTALAETASAVTTLYPPVNQIAFVSDRDRNFEIYLMNDNGSNPRNLTRNPANDLYPAWSPDGSQIAFESDRIGNGNPEVYVMDADGANPKRLTDNPTYDGKPAWSPDGTHILFVSNRDGNPEIYVMDIDGANQRNLTNNPASDSNPAWSPDGQKIAFDSNRGENGFYRVYVMDADGGNQQNLINASIQNGDEPSWSPDGKQIAFSRSNDIYMMDADGGNPHSLTTDGIIFPNFPVWSPDGQWIAYYQGQAGTNFDIFIIGVDGRNRHNITNSLVYNSSPAWRPLPKP